MADPDITRSVDGLTRAHRALDDQIAGLTDEDVRRPSLLPDWTVGHVLTHIARNADSVVRRLRGAARGELVDQYVGGSEGRAAEIEHGSDRSAQDLIEDVRRTSAEVEEVCASMTPEAWSGMTRSVDGAVQPCSRVVFSRWREVEVHLVDLGLGYTVDQWPADLVSVWLPDALAALPERTDPAQLLGWVIGRAPAPPLDSWD
jgi:maleylpyruvate isomerase